jgi:hypothetical protein
MDGRTELFMFLGAALATIGALFGAEALYISYIDTHVIHGRYATAEQDEKLAAIRAEEDKKLTTGALPIDKAIEALASRGRGVSNAIAPAQSSDLSAMSGWAHRHDFKPYAPRKAAPVAPAPVAAAPAPAAPVEGAAPAAPAVPAPAPATPAHAGAH